MSLQSKTLWKFMIVLETTLREFVRCIPTFKRGYNWDKIVSAIAESPQEILALIDANGKPQGTIKSNDLLVIISNNLIDSKNVFRYDSQRASAISTHSKIAKADLKDLEDAIIPSISLPSQMKIKDFLQRFTLQNRQAQNYLIVDSQERLLGILDTTKLIQALLYYTKVDGELKANSRRDNFLKSFNNSADIYLEKLQKPENTEKEISQQQLSETEIEFKEKYSLLFLVLNKFSLPLLIENSKGEICYRNNYWQLEAKNNLELRDKFNNSYLTKTSTNSFKKEKNSDCKHYSVVSNLSSLLPLSSLKLNPQIERLNSDLSENKYRHESTAKTIFKESDNFEQIEKNSSWYYYRIPLKIDRERIAVEDNCNYWLTFATRFSLQEFLGKPNLEQANSKQKNHDNLQQLQDELMRDLSHDLKSPLTTIIGLSNLLKEEKLGTLNQRQISYTEMIYNSGKRIVSSVNDLLDLTRLTSQKIQFNFETLNLKTVCQEIYQQLEQKLATKAKYQGDNCFPQLELELAPNAQRAIADRTYLNQILTRLLENALHSTSSEQLLGVRSELCSEWLAITVWNEEGGLTQEQQQILVAEFFQDVTFLNSQQKNQGLKLILAQQLAQAHGGDISFISQQDYGSEFTLLLPLNPHRNSEAIDSHSSEKKQNKPLILIVETASDKIINLSQKLKTLGYYSAIARTETEALYKARLLKPQKILLNSSFLEISQPNIADVLNFDAKTQNIPLLIITNTAKSIDSFDNIADEVISFPLSRSTLAKHFPLIVTQPNVSKQNLTVLRLSLTEKTTQTQENSILDFIFDNSVFSLSYHIIEADSIEQAHLLAKIWTIDVVIWDGTTLESPEAYLLNFAGFKTLASIPVITLDAKTTAAANKIDNLVIFPCLLPVDEHSIEQLTQVIQIAAGIE